MARSVKKGPLIDKDLLNKVLDAQRTKSKKVIKIWSRPSAMLSDVVALPFAVPQGKKFVPVFVTENMVGHKMGEFAPTRTFHGHSGDRKVAAKPGAPAPQAASAAKPAGK